jgi:hypothetical protein
MDEQNPRLDSNRTAGSGQEYGASRERRSGDSVSDYGSARLDDGRSTPPAATGVEYDAAAATSAAPEQRTREIRAEIAQTREEMSETVNAIQDRLSPRNIASNAADSVKQAASDTARDIAESDSVQYVRSNPVPTAMVGIGLAGLAWMYFGGRETSDYSYSSKRMYERGGRRRSAYDTYNMDEYAAAGRTNRSTGYSSPSAYGSRTAAGERDYGARAAGTASELAREARHRTRRAQSSLQDTWNESPLLMGAAAAVVGALVGMAVPETDRENEWLGETRDSMVEDVQQTVRETVSKVQDAATNAVNLVTDQQGGEQHGGQQQVGQQQGSAGQQNTPFNQEMRGPGREDFGR